jgi:hypothetical protein
LISKKCLGPSSIFLSALLYLQSLSIEREEVEISSLFSIRSLSG